MLFFLRKMLLDRLGASDISEAIVSRVEVGTKAILYFFFKGNGMIPFLVVKVSSDGRYNEELRKEYANLNDIAGSLPARLKESIPATEGSGDWKGLYYYAQYYIPGEMLRETIDENRSYGDPTQNIRSAYEWLLGFQEATFKGVNRLDGLELNNLLNVYRNAFSPAKEEEAFLGSIESAIEAYGGREVGVVACHGDFFPGNILINEGRVRVIDWRFLKHSHHPYFDFFSLLLTFYTSKNGVTEIDDYEGHFGKLFFEEHWMKDFFVGLSREYARKNKIEQPLFNLMLELTLLEWSTKEYSISGAANEQDRIWRRRFVYYMKNRERFILKELD